VSGGRQHVGDAVSLQRPVVGARPGRAVGRDARGVKCWAISTIGRSTASDVGFGTTTARFARCRLTAGWAPGPRRGIPALGIDRSATAIRLAGRGGAAALLGDVFEPLPWMGRWQTVLLVDGNVGLGGDPRRILGRAAELLGRGGRCVAEFDGEAIGIRSRWVRLESAHDVGPWFRWASVGVDSAAALAAQVGLTMTGVRLVGGRVVASLAAM
jgi:hypothetical protein